MFTVVVHKFNKTVLFTTFRTDVKWQYSQNRETYRFNL